MLPIIRKTMTIESIGNKKCWASYVKQRDTAAKMKKLGRKQREFKPTKCVITSCTNNSFTVSRMILK
jgi:hypothetical protein